MDEWQERWIQESRGRVTFEFIKDVTFMMNNKYVQLNYEVTCFITGHGFFRANLLRFSLADDANCSCGDVQTSGHLLRGCPLTADIRSEVLDGAVPLRLDWYLENKKKFNKFQEIVKSIFSLHKNEVV